MNKLSILSKVDAADILLEPYPHVVVSNALDGDLYAELEHTFPADEIVADGRPVRETFYDYPACRVLRSDRVTPLWREFFRYHVSGEFFREIVDRFGSALRSLHPTLEHTIGRRLDDFRVGMRPGGRGDPFAVDADVSMECQFYVNYTRQARAVRGPHVDRTTELFAALLYFRRPHDASTGGDLEICQATDPGLYSAKAAVRISKAPAEIDPRRVKTIRTVPYTGNMLVFFLNSHRSIHTVTPRTATELTRRHINFCCDVQSELFEMRLPVRLRMRQVLERTPVMWRAAKYL